MFIDVPPTTSIITDAAMITSDLVVVKSVVCRGQKCSLVTCNHY
ncbi:hypothetical protein [Lysinibacillus sp. JNUCC-52]|nr:hypothetical protein JNUCC52_07700 [Lysinibacillus sp. JNUCC-52]